MKLTYVLPSYGSQVFAGAETGARYMAEQLAELPGWDVEVLTTCALDHSTWENALPPGEQVENGVRVRRLPARPSRLHHEQEFSARVLEAPERTSWLDARRWIDIQGPATAEFVDAVAACDADVIVFKPYIFSTSVNALPRVGQRAVFQTAAHDEPVIRLPAYRDPFRAAGGFLYNTHEERRLVEGLFPVAERPALVLGIGVDTPPPVPTGIRERLELEDMPYLICVGRVEAGKGVHLLRHFFARYKSRRGRPLKLVLVGSPVDPPLDHPDVVVAGAVDEAEKWDLLRHACFLVAPARYESFSMTVTEAWSVGTPVIVNGSCAPTRARCRRSGGGLGFDGYASFEVILDRLVPDQRLRSEMGERGRAHVDTHYRWPVLVPRLQRFLLDMADRATA